ncbi:MAG: DNA (cytosine-5-)-methyltransferase [Clostridia bacterium]|nr:DNA (cytosine-5-)-methyltransferase [Clostridia bacterium]
MIKLGTLFSGIGAVEQALKRLNIEHEIVFACDNGDIEIDYDQDIEMKKVKSMNTKEEQKEYVDNLYKMKTRKQNHVKQSYLANYKIDPNDFHLDVKLLDGTKYQGQVDLLVGGSPCQSFSTVGFQGGLEDTRGTLFYEYARIVKETKPKVFIYENVRGLTTHDKGKTWVVMQEVFEELGYNINQSIIDAKDYGIPQTRRRLFVVAFRKDINLKNTFKFPNKKELEFYLPDLLINNVKEGNFISKNSKIKLIKEPGIIEDKYFLSPKLEKYVMSTGTKTFYQKVEIDLKIARTVLSTMGNRHRAGIDNYMTLNGKIRMLTEREAHRLMGFPDDYQIVVSRAQAYKQAGNSIVVDVMLNILLEIEKTNVFKF